MFTECVITFNFNIRIKKVGKYTFGDFWLSTKGSLGHLLLLLYQNQEISLTDTRLKMKKTALD